MVKTRKAKGLDDFFDLLQTFVDQNLVRRVSAISIEDNEIELQAHKDAWGGPVVISCQLPDTELHALQTYMWKHYGSGHLQTDCVGCPGIVWGIECELN